MIHALSLVALIFLSLYTASSDITRVEAGLFRLINGLPAGLEPALGAVMQLGSYWAIIVFATAALLLRKHQAGLELLLAGNLAYWLAVLGKALVGRERPSFLIDNIHMRDSLAGVLGYPSGHVAVAVALCLVAVRYLPQALRYYLWALILLVAIARIYTGVHLPLDVIGGFLVGLVSVWASKLIIARCLPLDPGHTKNTI